MIRTATPADSDAIARIYNHYIANTIVTFEEQLLTPAELSERMSEVSSAGLPWFVAEQAGQVVGYAYAGKWKGRCAYRYSVETSVYLDPDAAGRGIGSQLYDALLPALGACGIHVAIAGIALPNEGSVALHEKYGFDKIGHFREVGFKLDQWIDVGYWQLTLGS